jgi:predicted HTH domain antitoxin
VLADAREGLIALVSQEGEPLFLSLPLGQSSRAPAATLEIAVALYDLEQISLEFAAEIAGLSYREMVDELGRRGIGLIRLAPDALDRELAAFGD